MNTVPFFSSFACVVFCSSLLAFTPAVAQTTSQSWTESGIRKQIENSIAQSEQLPSGQIDFEINDAVVTLTGTVGSLAEKRAATRLVESIRGVDRVQNQLEVRGQQVPDARLRQEVHAALAQSPSLQDSRLGITVQDGQVELLGSTDTQAKKELAAEIVANVRGVRDVQNEIHLDSGPNRTEGEIKEEIQARIEWDSRISEENIAVQVEGTEVNLSGTVDTALERRAAVAAAWVPAVSQVDDSDLLVVGPTRQDWMSWQQSVATLLERTAVDPVNLPYDRSDLLQRKAIRSALFYNPIVTTMPTVQVEEGVVTLSGRLDTLQQKMTAEQVAGEVAGVKRVYNFIRVRPNPVPPDNTLASRVRAALARDPYIAAAPVRIEAQAGEVWLRGEVNTTYLWGRAQEVAARVPGVSVVHNRLRVPVPGVDDPPPLYLERGVLRGESIFQNLRDRLFWQDFENVGVQVNGNVVTLTGTVESWAQKWSAYRQALAAGAEEVNNLIQVNYPDGLGS